jgi:hypothetical protein
VDKIIQGMQTANKPSDYWLSSDIHFPELEDSKSVIHRNNQSVWVHTMQVIDLLILKNPVTLLASLFHDLGKCYVENTGNPSMPRFPCHAIESANIAKMKLTEWQASSYLIDRVNRIILTHMYDIVRPIREKTIRRFIVNIGLDNIENWFALRRADSASYSNHGQYKRYIIDPFYKSVRHYLDRLPSKDNSLQSPSESNVAIVGKDHEINDISLLMEG